MAAGRLPTAVLAGMVAVGLWLGWQWWTGAAPPDAGSSPGAGLPPGTGLLPGGGVAIGPALPRTGASVTELPVAPVDGSSEIRVVDPADGAPDLLVVIEEPVTGYAPRGGSDPAGTNVALDPELMDWLLPAADGAVLYTATLLGSAAESLVEGPGVPGGYRLEVACHGPGSVEVLLSVADLEPWTMAVSCGGGIAAMDVDLTHGHAALRLVPVTEPGRSLMVASQLVRLG